MFEQKRFFRARMTLSYSLLATIRQLILVDPAVQIDEAYSLIFLPLLLCVIRSSSGGSYLSNTIAQHTQTCHFTYSIYVYAVVWRCVLGVVGSSVIILSNIFQRVCQ